MKTLWKPPAGKIVKVAKKILNIEYNDCTGAAIASIENIGGVVHYTLSPGADNEIRIIGEENWISFLKFLNNLNWSQQDTDKFYILEEDLPLAEEIDDDYIDSWMDTGEYCQIDQSMQTDTLELPVVPINE